MSTVVDYENVCERLSDDMRDAEAARASADALAGLLRSIVEAYAARFDAPGRGLVGPIDPEIEQAQAALAQHSAGEARVAVKLPARHRLAEAHNTDSGEPELLPHQHGNWLCYEHVIAAIRAAGYPVEGD